MQVLHDYPSFCVHTIYGVIGIILSLNTQENNLNKTIFDKDLYLLLLSLFSPILLVLILTLNDCPGLPEREPLTPMTD